MLDPLPEVASCYPFRGQGSLVACTIKSVLYPEYYIVITPSVHHRASRLPRKFRLVSLSAFLTVDVRPVGRRISSADNDGNGGSGGNGDWHMQCNATVTLLHTPHPNPTPILTPTPTLRSTPTSTPNSVENQARRYHGVARHQTMSATVKCGRA